MLRQIVTALARNSIPRRGLAMQTIRMPIYPESVTVGYIDKINYKIGDWVPSESVVMEVETAKVPLEIKNPSKGILKELHVKEGDDTVPSQANLFTIKNTLPDEV
ncbi:MAG: putative dihydrolipoyllysine-residue succinyltransferase component of 2-oxoglutarate dehydrogenase complex [Edafosvirus sp.]|uniref:Putative dihydrolipoyllysine-residue succinyltransferase component of 2-oxoglutarate dehydrogenase complex n=1 Tax=Edafosvirus sp. TaxID=2487765 RepID=A0A3G4ZUT5_9VIRU|nr:MAG: putative dihydrolipoyllysine-residue succinyltransferase component of 2-oxoglutarate dehydrogenase complex [Edafosvirus sp.]